MTVYVLCRLIMYAQVTCTIKEMSIEDPIRGCFDWLRYEVWRFPVKQCKVAHL